MADSVDAELPGYASLVQRERQMALLAHALGGPPGIAIVEGEAGVGKSRLVYEALAAATPSRPVWTGHCYPQREPSPLLPIVEALRTAGPALAGAALSPVSGTVVLLMPELSGALPSGPDLAVADPGVTRHQLFRGLAEILRAVSPAILVLEDLHWADESTGEFLHFLVAQSVPDLHLVLTYRREELPRDSPLRSLASRLPAGTPHVRIELAGLDVPAVKRMVEDLLRTEVSDDFAEFIHARTAGLPFAVEEVLRLLHDRRDLVRLHGRWARHALDRMEVPVAISDAIGERIDRLPPAARDVVAAVAVLGADATVARTHTVSAVEGDAFEDALAAALSSALVRAGPGGTLEFRHELARAAAYGGVGPLDRHALHRRAAAVLVADGTASAARITTHLREADDPAWVTYAEQAAHDASRLFDAATAFELLRDVVQSGLVRDDDLIRVTRQAGRVGTTAYRGPETAEVIRSVLDSGAGSVADRGELERLLGVTLLLAGEMAAAYGTLVRCVADLPAGDPAAARAMSLLAFPVVDEVPVAEHLDWLDRALAAVEGSDDEHARLSVLGNAATVRLVLGRCTVEEAWSAVPWGCGEDHLVRIQESSHRRNLAEAAGYVGEYAAGRAALAEAAAFDRSLGGESPEVRATGVYLDFVAGEWDGLDGRADAVAPDVASIPQARAPVALVRTLLAAATGHTTRLRADLEALAESARATGVPQVFLHASAALAYDLLDSGAPAAARVPLTNALTSLRRKGVWAWSGEVLPATARLVVTAGWAETDGLFAEARAGLAGLVAPAATAGLLVAEGLVGGDPEVVEAGIAAWLALPRPYDAARALESLAALPSADAEAAWVRAAALYEGLGASRDLARVHRALRERGLAVPARRKVRAGEALSPREGEIADLVARGLSNKEIAEQLFLSPRTVEHHLERAMRKLGVRNRTALSAERARDGAAPDR